MPVVINRQEPVKTKQSSAKLSTKKSPAGAKLELNGNPKLLAGAAAGLVLLLFGIWFLFMRPSGVEPTKAPTTVAKEATGTVGAAAQPGRGAPNLLLNLGKKKHGDVGDNDHEEYPSTATQGQGGPAPGGAPAPAARNDGTD